MPSFTKTHLFFIKFRNNIYYTTADKNNRGFVWIERQNWIILPQRRDRIYYHIYSSALINMIGYFIESWTNSSIIETSMI